jgi:RNA polymerase sigma-70 factor (ECF subfamily)
MVMTPASNAPRYGRYAVTTPDPIRSAATVFEAVLVDRCKAGDSGAWDALLRRYGKWVYRLAYSHCRNHEEAEDIAGQVFLRLYQNLHTFRSEASLTFWLAAIIHNAYLDMCVRPPYRRFLSLEADWTSDDEPAGARDIIDPAPTPEQICMENETARLLNTVIRHLPAYHVQILRMYHSEGKSYKQIAQELALSLGTVRSRLNRARTMLRERWNS